MSTSLPSSVRGVTIVRRRQVSKTMTTQLYGVYSDLRTLTNESSHSPYQSLAAMIGVIRSPDARARARLKEITALDADWNAIGSAPPNQKARELAFDVLEKSYALGIIEPSLVTASAQGGIGIVYKANGSYAALECLNVGQVSMLWFDREGTPHSRRIRKHPKALEEALRQIADLHARR